MPIQQPPQADLAPQDGSEIPTLARAGAADPSAEAAAYLEATRHDGVPSLVFWRGAWLRWRASAYHVVPLSEVRADLIRWLTPRCRPLTSHFTNYVLDCVQALAMMPGWVEQPTWRDDDGPIAGPWPAGEMLATPKLLVHLPSFGAARDDSIVDARTADDCGGKSQTLLGKPAVPHNARPAVAHDVLDSVVDVRIADDCGGESQTLLGKPAVPHDGIAGRPDVPPELVAMIKRYHVKDECREVIPAPRQVGGEVEFGRQDVERRGEGGSDAGDRGRLEKTSPACYALPPTPRFFNATALEFDFDENAPPPVEWLRFLDSLWRDDRQSVELLQDWFGYLLTPDTSHQKILLVVGPQRSGKGTIARVARGLVGPDNVAAPTLTSLAGRFGLWPLVGRTLAIIPDARLSARVDGALVTERLLSTSGEDVQTVERKNRGPVTVRLPTRLMVLSNELPRLSDSSGALASRMLLLRIERTFLEREDLALATKLLAELPGILRWAIVGWQRLRRRGYFVQPERGLDLLDELGDLASPVSAFIKERCEVGDAGWRTVASDLFAAWSAWCRANGRRDRGNVQSFGRALKAALPTLRTAYPNKSGIRRRVYDGIRLLEEEEEDWGVGNFKRRSR